MAHRSIALVGLAGTGKDTLAEYISFAYGHYPLSFAAPLKRVAQLIYGFTDRQMFGASRHRNEPDTRYKRPDGTYLTPREALERIGTEACRRCYEDTWLDLAMQDAAMASSRGSPWVFTDCRYRNEIDACRARGALIVRLTRSGIISKGHASEEHSLLPDSSFDFVLSTDGTVAETRALFDRFYTREVADEIKSSGFDQGSKLEVQSERCSAIIAQGAKGDMRSQRPCTSPQQGACRSSHQDAI